MLDVDMVIKAAGQVPFEDLIRASNVKNKSGKLTIDENNMTSVRGIFGGGDCVNGGKEVVDAVQAGKDGAKGILKYLHLTHS